MKDFYEIYCKEIRKNWQELLDDVLEYLDDFKGMVNEMIERVNMMRNDVSFFLFKYCD